MAEQKQVKSKRDLMVERLKAKYPDREYADDEALFGQIGDDYDESEKELGGYKEREGKLTDLLAKDTHAAQFITDMAQGKDPMSSLIKRIGIDGIEAMLKDPAAIDKYAADNKEYIERLNKSKQLEEEWEKNMHSTLQMLEAKQKELGLTDEQLDSAADWIKELTNDALFGIIKPGSFDMALKAINHDADVAAADQEGEVRGRNAKAEAMLRKPSRGDGLPALSGAPNTQGNTPPSKRSLGIFEQARAAK